MAQSKSAKSGATASTSQAIAVESALPSPHDAEKRAGSAIALNESESKIAEYHADMFRAHMRFGADRIAKAGVVISKEKLERLAAIYADVGLKREALEEQLTKSTALPDQRILLEISAYPEQGQKLMQELYARFDSELGKDQGSKLKKILYPSLSMENRAWGTAGQLILIAKDAGGIYSFTHGIEDRELDMWAQDLKTGRAERMTGSSVQQSRLFKSDLGVYAAKAKYLPQG